MGGGTWVGVAYPWEGFTLVLIWLMASICGGRVNQRFCSSWNMFYFNIYYILQAFFKDSEVIIFVCSQETVSHMFTAVFGFFSEMWLKYTFPLRQLHLCFANNLSSKCKRQILPIMHFWNPGSKRDTGWNLKTNKSFAQKYKCGWTKSVWNNRIENGGEPPLCTSAHTSE